MSATKSMIDAINDMTYAASIPAFTQRFSTGQNIG